LAFINLLKFKKIVVYYRSLEPCSIKPSSKSPVAIDHGEWKKGNGTDYAAVQYE